jgi:hypothetical protein
VPSATLPRRVAWLCLSPVALSAPGR